MKKVTAIFLGCQWSGRARELRIRRIYVCVTHIQLVSGAVSGDPWQTQT
jgi:hypothetical protein